MPPVHQAYCSDHFIGHILVESLCRTPETITIVYINCNLKRNGKKKKRTTNYKKETMTEFSVGIEVIETGGETQPDPGYI